MGNSTITLNNVLDDLRRFAELKPVFGSGGSAQEPMLTIANEVFQYLFSPQQPWKFNRITLPFFYTNSWQQDYALVNKDGSSVTNLGYLDQGVIVDINNTSIPKPVYPLEVVRSMQQSFGQYGIPTGANWFMNKDLVYGTWGGATSDMGNDPQAGSVYTSPLGLPGQPVNPIMQIQDANGNLLVLTTFGVEGSAAPLAAVGAPAGTTVSGLGATTVWTVVDPKGSGIRIAPLPSQTGTVYQIRLTGQFNPPFFTKLSQTLDPLPDNMSRMFTDGARAYAWRYSPEEKLRGRFEREYQLWTRAVDDARKSQNREKEEFGFVPSSSIMGGPSCIDPGPAYPFDGYWGWN